MAVACLMHPSFALTTSGYARDLKEFTARGLQVTRCPTTQRLRVSTAEEPGLAATAAAVMASIRASEESAAAAAAAAAVAAADRDGHASPAPGIACHRISSSEDNDSADAFATPPSFSFASSPSEVISSINNINLAESIAKHKQWAMPLQGGSAGGKAAAAAAVTVAVASRSDSSDGEDTQAAAC